MARSRYRRTKAHLHEAHESAYCVLGGEEVEVFTGDRLEDRQIVHPGDYWFMPAKVPHVAVKRGTKPAVFIGARKEPTAKESQIMRPELDATGAAIDWDWYLHVGMNDAQPFVPSDCFRQTLNSNLE